MNNMLKNALIRAAPLVDLLMSPLTFIAAFWLKTVRRIGVDRMRISKLLFRRVGVFPVRDQYYEPLVNGTHLKKSLAIDRPLPGLNLNEAEQLALLDKFHYNDELIAFSLEKRADREFYYHNGAFESGDAEYLFNVIRLFKPRKIVEVGSGYSTLMAIGATNRNRDEDAAYDCRQICIEPYEQPWLEALGVTVLRERVEDIDKEIFRSLEANDILFIDSSHVIRPQGDVLCEYLEILPLLKSGVLIHVHDIFTPRDYPHDWIVEKVRLWNEQYLLEAFLSFNGQFRVIGALNYLRHRRTAELVAKCPILKIELTGREPGSFWMIRN